MSPIQHFFYSAPISAPPSGDTYQDMPWPNVDFDTTYVGGSIPSVTNGESIVDLASVGADYYEAEFEIVTANDVPANMTFGMRNASNSFVRYQITNSGSVTSNPSFTTHITSIGGYLAGDIVNFRVYTDRMEFRINGTLEYTYNYGHDVEGSGSDYYPTVTHTSASNSFKLLKSRFVNPTPATIYFAWDDIDYDTQYGNDSVNHYASETIDLSTVGVGAFFMELTNDSGNALYTGVRKTDPNTNFLYDATVGRILQNNGVLADAGPTPANPTRIRMYVQPSSVQFFITENGGSEVEYSHSVDVDDDTYFPCITAVSGGYFTLQEAQYYEEWPSLDYNTTYGSGVSWQFTTLPIDIDTKATTSYVHDVKFLSNQSGKGLSVGFGTSSSVNVRLSTENGRIIRNGSIIDTFSSPYVVGDIIRGVLLDDRIEWRRIEPDGTESLVYTYTFSPTDYADGTHKALVVVSSGSSITFELKAGYYTNDYS